MDRILKGIIRYRNVKKEKMVKQFKEVKDNPTVSNFYKKNIFCDMCINFENMRIEERSIFKLFFVFSQKLFSLHV